MKNGYKIFYCLTLLVAFILLNLLVKSYLKPAFFMAMLYAVALPFYNFLSKAIKSRRLATFIVLFSINITSVLVLIYLGNYIIALINRLMLEAYTSTFIKNFMEIIGIDKESIWKNIRSLNNPIFLKGALFTGEAIVMYFISNITVYFLLADRRIFVSFIKIFIRDDVILNIKNILYNIKKIFSVELALVIFSTTETLLGFLLLGVEDALALSILCGLLDLLPYVGTVIVFVPLIIYNILINQYFVVFGLIFLYILINILRQVFEVKVIGDKFSIHPLVIILALYIGINLFGFFGLLIGPLYVIIAKEIIFN